MYFFSLSFDQDRFQSAVNQASFWWRPLDSTVDGRSIYLSHCRSIDYYYSSVYCFVCYCFFDYSRHLKTSRLHCSLDISLLFRLGRRLRIYRLALDMARVGISSPLPESGAHTFFLQIKLKFLIDLNSKGIFEPYLFQLSLLPIEF